MYTLYSILYTIYYIAYIYTTNKLYIIYIYGVSVDLTGRVYVKMYLLTQVDCTCNENVPRKNSQKIADILIEDFHLYIAELVENMPKYRISGKNCIPISVGGLNSFYMNILTTKIKFIWPWSPFKQLMQPAQENLTIERK